MCGIVGFLDKTQNSNSPVGKTILTMLTALGVRGPDSAGVALYGSSENGAFTLQVKLGELDGAAERGTSIAEEVKVFGSVHEVKTTAEYLRLVIDLQGEAIPLTQFIESLGEDIEVVSMGRELEIVKQVGTPQNLDATHSVSTFRGNARLGTYAPFDREPCGSEPLATFLGTQLS